ncbi:MAG: hypothetical protein LCH73_07215 [Proteobacteria bacterium]|nr:hypothetical protein [Pseudomonadota bacterium]
MNSIHATYGALRTAIVHATEHAQDSAHEHEAGSKAAPRRWFSPRDRHDARADAAAQFLAVYPSGSGR